MKELMTDKITNSQFVNQVKIEFTSKSITAWGGLVVLIGKFLEKMEEDNLNLDSTVLTRYGTQQGAERGYNPHKPGRRSHYPLLAFVGSGYVVNVWNRAGNVSSGQLSVDFFKQTAHA